MDVHKYRSMRKSDSNYMFRLRHYCNSLYDVIPFMSYSDFVLILILLDRAEGWRGGGGKDNEIFVIFLRISRPSTTSKPAGLITNYHNSFMCSACDPNNVAKLMSFEKKIR